MKHILRCATILAALALGFSLNSCENNVTNAVTTKTLTLTGQCTNANTMEILTKSLEIEYTDNDTWEDIAERYAEVSLVANISDGIIVKFWYESEEDYGCELKSNESTYPYNLVGINDKVSAYSSYFLE